MRFTRYCFVGVSELKREINEFKYAHNVNTKNDLCVFVMEDASVYALYMLIENSQRSEQTHELIMCKKKVLTVSGSRFGKFDLHQNEKIRI